MGNGCPSKTMAPTRDNELAMQAMEGHSFQSNGGNLPASVRRKGLFISD